VEEKLDCFSCQYHIQNDDTGMFECQGQDEICHEFIEKTQSK
jgi:hypothetical protein